MKPEQGMRDCVYRQYDENGVLLYVGLSSEVEIRTRAHSSSARWFTRVANIKIERFPSRDEAMAAELRAIRTERPLYNKTGNVSLEAPDPRAPKPPSIEPLGEPSAHVKRAIAKLSPEKIAQIKECDVLGYSGCSRCKVSHEVFRHVMGYEREMELAEREYQRQKTVYELNEEKRDITRRLNAFRYLYRNLHLASDEAKRIMREEYGAEV